MNVESSLQPLARGTVTQANMKISAVDGTAFIDFSAADVLTGKIGCLLVVKDSSGNKIQGFTKAAGTGETYGSEQHIASNAASDPNANEANALTGWSPFGTPVTRESTSNGSPNVGSYHIHIITNGQYQGTLSAASIGENLQKLCRVTFDKKISSINANGHIRLSVNNSTTATSYFWKDYTETSIYTSEILYGTPTENTTVLIFGSWPGGTVAAEAYLDNLSLTQVLTPSATGVTITSTKGGATYNWANKSSSFNYNDASGYTYEIYRVPPTLVASGTVTQANFHADLTSDNAFVELVGVDLSAYQDGHHVIGIYNVTGGFGILGHISATAPAGETLDSNLGPTACCTDPDNDQNNTTGWTPTNATLSSIIGGVTGKELKVLATADYGFGKAAIVGILGALYRIKHQQAADVGTYSLFGIGKDFVGSLYSTDWVAGGGDGVWTAGDIYRTDTVGCDYVLCQCANNAASSYFDDISIKRVLDPPSTGARIVSTQGGATRAYYSQSASFDPNHADGVSYKIWLIGD